VNQAKVSGFERRVKKPTEGKICDQSGAQNERGLSRVKKLKALSF
jgi:hypothetical protein